MAGPNGSIQGPAEAKWGYTTLSVADWDGDGLPDLIVNSIWGKVVWYRNSVPAKLRSSPLPEPIEVEWDESRSRPGVGLAATEGKALLTQWRTTPCDRLEPRRPRRPRDARPRRLPRAL